ncbi:NAD-dependent epimerase/dehydratase family protein [Agrococcus sp. ARC_14]|uniref:NAD-dependent epimerase/dehydratase family protein n=1 Tax=Agrococcus sp. ARC_14 TaxID=2919927 RepID=UPI001F0579F8|nr:NAD-dependent epimerase/dehydratase family protein [Agrococcus sp. ARC_14]MCH1882294.1 NAD-dependent epimerase/dehydratase family protein [Agrococcus sp. ARC_14]
MRSGRVLVTGASGFVGIALTQELVAAGHAVYGTSAGDASHTVGLTDYFSHDLTAEPLPTSDYDAIVHLAALAAVGPSFDDPQRYIESNSAMMTNLCEPLLASQSQSRILVVSSGSVYDAQAESPTTESAPFGYDSPYAVSKVLVESQAAYYRKRGLDTVVVRPFNHIGPGQRRGFIVPDLVSKLQALGPGEPLQAGSLDGRRDYTDVRDVVRAYRLLLEAEQLASPVYNVASGASASGWEVLRTICAVLGIDEPPVQIQQRRALDQSSVTGDASRLISETGWSTEHDLRRSIHDFVASLSERGA